LSTLRVAVSADVHLAATALPAESCPVVRPRLAAAATPTDRSRAITAIPNMLLTLFNAIPSRKWDERGRLVAPLVVPPVRQLVA
jgi:hypothetical protein